MKNNRIKKIALTVSTVISLVIFVILFNVVTLSIKRESQQERINVLEKVINYKSALEKSINSRVEKVNGYLAFIKTYPDIDKKDSLTYITNLIDPNEKLIRNISVLKDTTIVWVYPEKGNEGAIGKDISTVSTQKESVLLAKNSGITIFQGPINLIQGGIGFVARVPVFDEKNNYWGQISVVINGEELIKSLSGFEKEYSLKISLYNKRDYPNSPFFGDKISSKENPLIFSTSINNAEWVIAAIPKGGWQKYLYKYTIWHTSIFLLTIFIGVILYKYIYATDKIKKQLNYDALTGVHSRAFLESYEKVVLARALRTKTKVGIIVVDLNNFKDINDKYGHVIGDKALQLVAKNLLTSCRISDTVVRTGGDEFLLLFPDIKNHSEFEKIIIKIDDNKNMTLVYGAGKIDFVYSAGHSLYPDDGETIDKIINKADKEMYKNKKISKEKNI